ncbi:MAG: MarR family transcriptional regulator [Desulfovibrio sp.]|jgi:DNA-binding MarR family transcriptional regulator|nr:MarR family transcriptional regulator [Desulfovibrio sp.]
MSAFFFDLHNCLGYMSVTTHRVLSSTLSREMLKAGIDLTGEQWGVLVCLWNKATVTQDELAEIACVDKSTMSRVLSLMEKNGLIARRTDLADARRKCICTTAHAQEIQQRSLDVVRTVLAHALDGVDPRDSAVCLDVLAAVKKNLRKRRKPGGGNPDVNDAATRSKN